MPKPSIPAFLQRLFSLNRIDGGGERVDITYSGGIDYESLDVYQKSHLQRYLFAAGQLGRGRDVADLACGTGYGSALMATTSREVTGVDIDARVIRGIGKRYGTVPNLKFLCSDLLRLSFDSCFDYVVSFETVEHLPEKEIPRLFGIFAKALRPGGTLIFSTPYLQPRSPEAIRLGFHRTFDIDENAHRRWTRQTGLEIDFFKYQNYQTHEVQDALDQKDFVICVATKL